MKTYRPARVRAVSFVIHALVVTAIFCALGVGLVYIPEWERRMDGRPTGLLRPEDVASFVALGIGGFGMLIALLGLTIPSARYEMGPTAIKIRRGALWKSTWTLPYVDIVRVESFSGPLMRLFGIEDLKLFVPMNGVPVTLYGIRGADELKAHIDARREAMHEAVLEGDYSVARTPQDMIFERLDRVLERIERHMPGGKADDRD